MRKGKKARPTEGRRVRILLPVGGKRRSYRTSKKDPYSRIFSAGKRGGKHESGLEGRKAGRKTSQLKEKGEKKPTLLHHREETSLRRRKKKNRLGGPSPNGKRIFHSGQGTLIFFQKDPVPEESRAQMERKKKGSRKSQEGAGKKKISLKSLLPLLKKGRPTI